MKLVDEHPVESAMSPFDFKSAWMRPGMVLIDLETTGLDPEAHSAFEYAAYAWNGTWIFNHFRMRPGRMVDPEALRVNGQSVESLDVREVGYFQAMEDLYAWLDELRGLHHGQLVLAGMNPHFDRGFLESEWNYLYTGPQRQQLRRPWSHRQYDLHTLALNYLHLFNGSSGERLHSDAISELLGVEPEAKPHGAINGVNWAGRCFARIYRNTEKLKEALK